MLLNTGICSRRFWPDVNSHMQQTAWKATAERQWCRNRRGTYGKRHAIYAVFASTSSTTWIVLPTTVDCPRLSQDSGSRIQFKSSAAHGHHGVRSVAPMLMAGCLLAPAAACILRLGGWKHGQMICRAVSRRHCSGLQIWRNKYSAHSSTEVCAGLMHLHAWVLTTRELFQERQGKVLLPVHFHRICWFALTFCCGSD